MTSILVALFAALLARPANLTARPPPLLLDGGHTAGVDALAFSRDGRRLASGSNDGTVRLFDGKTGHVQAELRVTFGGWIHGVAFSPDGARLAVASSYSAAATLWDTRTGAFLSALLGYQGHSLAFADDGRLVTLANDHGVSVWRGEKAEVFLRAPYLKRVSISPDGKRLAAWSAQTFQLWDAPFESSSKPVVSWPLAQIETADVTWGARPRVATTAAHGVGIVLRALDGTEEARLDSSTPFASFLWSPDGKHVAAGARDGTVVIYDAAKRRIARTLDTHRRSTANSLAWSPDSARIAIGDDRGRISVWSFPDGGALADVPAQGMSAGSVAWGPGNRVAVVGPGGTSTLFDVESGKVVADLGGQTFRVEWCGDGWVGLTGEGRTLAWWDGKTGASLASASTAARMHYIICTPDGRSLVTYGYGLELWDPHNRVGRSLLGEDVFVRSAAFSPDGREVVVARDKGVEIWRLDGPLPRRRVRRDRRSDVVAWRRDGMVIATDDGRKDVEKGRQVLGKKRGMWIWDTRHLVALDPRSLAFRGVVRECVAVTLYPCVYDSAVFGPRGDLAMILDRFVQVTGDASSPWRDAMQGTGWDAAHDVTWSPDGQTLVVSTKEGVLFLRAADDRALRWRGLRVGGKVVGLLEDAEGHFTGDEEACARVIVRGADGALLPSAEVQKRRRPDLLARFRGNAPAP
jgi:WD40 repeat protein